MKKEGEGWRRVEKVMVFDSHPSAMLTTNEVARQLHLHINTVRRWSDQGLIKTHRISSRGDRRYRQEDIARFLAELALDNETR